MQPSSSFRLVVPRPFLRPLYLVLFLSLLLLALTIPLSAAPVAWGLDPTFGDGGRVITNIGPDEYAADLLIQPDGKIVIAGSIDDGSGTLFASKDFGVARYESNGALDTSFGGTGYVSTDFGDRDDRATTVLLQGDGRIVAVGWAWMDLRGPDFAVARYHSDGTLDDTFRTDGTTVTDFYSSSDIAHAAIIQPDGKVLAVGNTSSGEPMSSAPQYHIALVRHNGDGTLDVNFGTEGKVETDFGGHYSSARAVILQPDGKIVIGGFIGSYASNGPYGDFLVVRYDADGELDTTFGDDGRVMTDFEGRNDELVAMVLQPDGKLLAVGKSLNPPVPTSTQMAIARYDADGNPDSSFDGDGRRLIELPAGNGATATDVALQSDGALIVSGYTSNPNRWTLQRFLADGTTDMSFGADGTVFADLGGTFNTANALAFQEDGRIVVGGAIGYQRDDRPMTDIALARFTADAPPPPPPPYDHHLWLPLVGRE